MNLTEEVSLVYTQRDHTDLVLDVFGDQYMPGNLEGISYRTSGFILPRDYPRSLKLVMVSSDYCAL